MTAVNVSEEGMDRIEQIQEDSEFDPSKREIVDKALIHYQKYRSSKQTAN